MRCSNCYREIPDDALCCPYCGEENLAAGIRTRTEESREPQADQGQQVSQEPQADQGQRVSQEPQADQTVTGGRETQNWSWGKETAEEEQGFSDQAAESGTDFRTEQQEAQEVHGVPYTYGNSSAGQEAAYGQNAYQVPEKTVNWVPYLVLAIISTICCCPPFGIVAIVYAVKINSEVSDGDEQKAADSARKAKIWIIVAVASGIVWDLLMIFLGLFSAMGGVYFY